MSLKEIEVVVSGLRADGEKLYIDQIDVYQKGQRRNSKATINNDLIKFIKEKGYLTVTDDSLDFMIDKNPAVVDLVGSLGLEVVSDDYTELISWYSCNPVPEIPVKITDTFIIEYPHDFVVSHILMLEGNAGSKTKKLYARRLEDLRIVLSGNK